MLSELSFRRANSSDALCLSALATQVFLETYATEGIRPWLAREVQERFAARIPLTHSV
jgi:diamine N-acetyltransferase